jgi:membrane-associated HD superfamily phosphohydrolase
MKYPQLVSTKAVNEISDWLIKRLEDLDIEHPGVYSRLLLSLLHTPFKVNAIDLLEVSRKKQKKLLRYNRNHLSFVFLQTTFSLPLSLPVSCMCACARLQSCVCMCTFRIRHTKMGLIIFSLSIAICVYFPLSRESQVLTTVALHCLMIH